MEPVASRRSTGQTMTTPRTHPLAALLTLVLMVYAGAGSSLLTPRHHRPPDRAALVVAQSHPAMPADCGLSACRTPGAECYPAVQCPVPLFVAARSMQLSPLAEHRPPGPSGVRVPAAAVPEQLTPPPRAPSLV